MTVAAVAPIAWGTTYFVTTEALPPDRPLFAATMRALPVALALAVAFRRPPASIGWWGRAAALGVLNIGLFFPLLFVAAYRLPGGLAATIGAIQPLLVVLLSGPLLADPPTLRRLCAGAVGALGVLLLVLRAPDQIDSVGVEAALAASFSMAVGVVLTKRWGRPVPLLVFTMWQLLAGGLFLGLLMLLVEGAPATLTATNLAGFAYIGLVGTGIAYALWFRALERLPAPAVSFLGLLSPVVATVVGFAVLGQSLAPAQAFGSALVFAAVLLGTGARTAARGA